METKAKKLTSTEDRLLRSIFGEDYDKPKATSPPSLKSRLNNTLKKYMLAQSRMKDKWAEGDCKVKDTLWKNLHAIEDEARDLLAEIEKGELIS